MTYLLEHFAFIMGALLMLRGIRLRRKYGKRGWYPLAEELLVHGSLVRAVYRWGKGEEKASIVRGEAPRLKGDIMEFLVESSKLGRRAIMTLPEVNRHISELEELEVKVQEVEKALSFRGRLMSAFQSLILPIAVRFFPLIIEGSKAGQIGMLGEVWVYAICVSSAHFLTQKVDGGVDLPSIGISLMLAAISNYLAGLILDPLLLRVLINPLGNLSG